MATHPPIHCLIPCFHLLGHSSRYHLPAGTKSSMTIMVHRRPQSPHDDLQYGFNHLAQHNAQWQDNGGFANPGHNTFSSSLMSHNGPPQSDFYMNQGYGGGQYHEIPHDGAFGLGMQYPAFEAPSQGYYAVDGQEYHNLAVSFRVSSWHLDRS